MIKMELKHRQQNDRRSKFRFSIQREIRYKTLQDGAPIASGTGRSIDVGSGGVAFATEQPLRPGAFVEVSMSWPVLLDQTCPMRLIAFGRVLRNSGKKNVCSIDKYEFRTQARTFQADAVPRSDGMLQRWAEGIRRETPKTSEAGA
jgi:hypothetical protein